MNKLFCNLINYKNIQSCILPLFVKANISHDICLSTVTFVELSKIEHQRKIGIMSKNEQERPSKSIEGNNEEAKKSNKTSKKKKISLTTSLRSYDGPVKSFIRAVQRGSPTTTTFIEERELIELNIMERDDSQRNAFHYAVSKPNTLKDLLKVFENTMDIGEALRQADKAGELPIHRAAVLGIIESLEMLCTYDDTLLWLRTTRRNESVLHSAVKSKSLLVVKYVLTYFHKEDPQFVNAVDNMLQSPVHYAAAFKQSNVLELLLSNGCDSTLIDTNDQIPLHIACSKGILKNVQLLVQDHPDSIDVVDYLAQTPLILAAKYGFPNVVSYLLGMKASCALKDKTNFTAFDWALQRNLPDVVQCFLNTSNWKKILKESENGPESSLCAMITGMPETAKLLLDKCIETKECDSGGCITIYDFFCLESKDRNCSGPRFAALQRMTIEPCEICLRHPVSKKYVDVKWGRRGFKCVATILLLTLIFHISLLLYTSFVVGVVDSRRLTHWTGGKNMTITEMERDNRAPNSSGLVVLRVVMLLIAFFSSIKESIQIIAERLRYFRDIYHWYRLAQIICVTVYLLHSSHNLAPTQIGFGAVTCLLSWVNVIQFLKLTPMFGIYVIVVEKVFWTLVKMFAVITVYVLMFSTTFYILLTEHSVFRNMYISFFSTFIAMMNGLDYDEYFLKKGMYPQLFHLKLFVLLLFFLALSIVVQNVLIGLAVGDTHEVMKLASFDKFVRRAKFVIRLERALNKIPCFRSEEDATCTYFSKGKKNLRQTLFDQLIYFDTEMDEVDHGDEDTYHDHEFEVTLEDHIENAVEMKIDNLRSSLLDEVKAMKCDLNDKIEAKIDKLLQKFEEER
ncbi:transient receptor potential cation channel subfamily A member 1-like isoform X2 [Xenia sp. Carnegie-2017]|uniref:transient receptor potential cation channel subfamily A member 1-like isoform X2 n=1 Tax=Xenia sp. Carnegie-2017 TaxID=2897299 RepID=UPI001F03D96F|nr:transient receptor potential cation channel subfamily A member 1-like isoform X2 [Xenia sp. Carnegie-2017]